MGTLAKRRTLRLSIDRHLRTAVASVRSAILEFPVRQVAVRWLTILCYGIVASAIVALAWPWTTAKMPRHLRTVGWGAWSAIPIVVLCTVLFVRALPELWRKRFGVRSFCRYPPAWSAAPLGVALLLWFWGLVPSAGRAATSAVAPGDFLVLARWASYTTLACWLFIGAATASLPRRKPLWRTGLEAEKCDLTSDFPALCKWLSDDKPINNPRNDAFGHHAIARRIATRVLTNPSTTVALLGALGAGKSSVYRLFEHELRAKGNSTRTEVVGISIWSYRTQEAAILGILDALLDALGAHVSTLPLRGLPAKYLDLLEHAGDLPSKAGRLLRSNASPESLLKEFDAVACAIERRFILWVEDDERFARTIAGEATANDPIGLVRSALHLLDRSKNISVLLASGTSRDRFDFEKVARYVEQLPQLEPSAVALVLEAFARGCFDGPPFVYIGRKLRELVPTRTNPDDGDDLEGLILGEHPRGIARTLSELCSTPRVLKQALRACLEKWDVLRGEIDFEDLLSMCVLREAEPSAFDLVSNHIDDLRATRRHMGEDPARDFWSALKKRYRRKDARLETITALINFVFERQSPVTKPQGIALFDHRDYWSRFMSVPDLGYDERDQPMLRAAQSGDLAELARRLANPHASRAAELLSVRAAPIDLPLLLSLVIEQRCGEDPANWGDRVPGIMPAWRMMLQRNRMESPPIDVRVLHATLLRGITAALPHSIVLVDELMRYFAMVDSEVESLLRDGDNELGPGLHARLHEMFTAAFNGFPRKLAQALRGRRYDALYYVAWTRSRVRAKQIGALPFSGWSEFAATLLQSAREHPDVVLPQVARFVVQENENARRGFDQGYAYDTDSAARLFTDSEVLLGIFREYGQGVSADWGPLAAVMAASASERPPAPP